MTKTNVLFFCFLCAMLSFLSCDNDNGPTYPIVFTLDNLEYNDAHIYTISDNDMFEEIAFAGSFVGYDDNLRAELMIGLNEFDFDQLTLLDENRISIRTTGPNPETSSFSYATPGNNLIRVYLDDTQEDFIDFDYRNGDSQIKYCIHSATYPIPSLSTDYTLDIETCDDTHFNASTSLENIRMNNNLSISDTVALNISYLVFAKE